METIKINMPRASTIQTNGVNLHVMQAGDKDGEPILLLHGFPEFWYGWHKQITPLAEAGYRVIVPDQRGYNLSDKPNGIEAYRVEELVKDMIGLIDHFGYEKVRLVGHDWGAIVAWFLAMWHPDRFEQLVIANVPHPYVFSHFLKTQPSQMMKSWYAVSFQMPVIPEMMIRANNYAMFANILADTGRLNEREINLYRQAWSQDGAMTAMVNWYRAYIQQSPKRKNDGKIHVDTLMLWGMKDFALSHEMAPPSIEQCDNGHLIFFKGANHFVQHERAEQITEMMQTFFAQGLQGIRETYPEQTLD